MKNNQKCVRLSDRVMKYIEAYRGDNFSERLENYVLDTEERRDRMVLEWERLDAEIKDKRRELEQLRSRLQRTAAVESRFAALETALGELLDT